VSLDASRAAPDDHWRGKLQYSIGTSTYQHTHTIDKCSDCDPCVDHNALSIFEWPYSLAYVHGGRQEISKYSGTDCLRQASEDGDKLC